MKEKRTLLAIRLRTQTARELSQLAGIFIAMAVGFVLFGALQIAVCRWNFPTRGFAECLVPLKKSFKVEKPRYDY